MKVLSGKNVSREQKYCLVLKEESKMNSNNIFRTGLAALLCASLLAGCGGGSSAGTSTSGGSDEGTSDEKVVATVTVWGPQEDQSDDNGKWLQT